MDSLAGMTVAGFKDLQHWAVLADPEGGEFCGFVRDRVPAYKLMDLVVDSADPGVQARWWAAMVGGDVQRA